MATVYCWDGGSDTAPYDTWSKAATSLQTAITSAGGAGTVLLASDHAESPGSNVNLTSPGSSPTTAVRVISSDRTDDSYKVAENVQLNVTGSLAFYDETYFYGVNFRCSTNMIFTEALRTRRFDDCTLEVSGLTNYYNLNSTYYSAFFENCTLAHGATSGTVAKIFAFTGQSALAELRNCTVTCGTTVTTLCDAGSSNFVRFIGCDLSGSQAGELFSFPTTYCPNAVLINCLLPSGVTLSSDSPIADQDLAIYMHNCDSGNGLHRFEERRSQGVSQGEFSIYRTPGASDGTTSFSIELASNAQAVEYINPLRIKLADVWVDTSTSRTFTAHIARDATATALQDDEVWLEVSYPDDTTAAYHWQNDRTATISTSPANQTDSTESWTGLGGTNKRQKLEVTTNQTGKLGPVQVYLALAKPNTTIYACPKIEVS